MKNIVYIDRSDGQKKIEKVYQNQALQLMYGDKQSSRFLRAFLLPLLTKFSLISHLYGYFQKKSSSRVKILPFIKEFNVNSSEFFEPIDNFQSFNDFFIRKLKKEARPLALGQDVAVMPADGRYLFYERLKDHQVISVKGKQFYLKDLLQNDTLAHNYANGSLIFARLCPSDYHRFHFPVDCVPSFTHTINGYLQSVNPLAVQLNLKTFLQNKRTLCLLQTKSFGEVLFMEIGALNVGSICQTYKPSIQHNKGDEKGYFEFGGSALILLFKENTIRIDQELIQATQEGFETYCLFGQRLGQAINQ